MNRLINVHRIIVHGAYTTPTMDIGDDEIKSWHTAKGWEEIGYHMVIRRDARLEYGRSFDEQGAHAPPHNDTSIGVCLVGGKHPTYEQWEMNYTYPQLAKLGFVCDWLKVMWPSAIVLGHNEVTPGRECPGFDVNAWWHARSA